MSAASFIVRQAMFRRLLPLAPDGNYYGQAPDEMWWYQPCGTDEWRPVPGQGDRIMERLRVRESEWLARVSG